ncbi:MAG: hypothetical protein ACRD3N_17170 [Terracidiphilus sp.]
MRATLDIDDDVLAAAKEMAASEGRSVGEIVSSLARQAMGSRTAQDKMRNGIPLLPARPGQPHITSELVRQLHEEIR